MSRLFLTNIDLNSNELQNAVVQNLSSAPLSGNKEGRIYYDVTNKALYLYTDGQWKPLASGGAAASSIELTGDVTGTANVDPATGKLTVETTVDSSFVTLTGTQTLTNKTFQGRTYLKSAGGAGGTGVYLDVDNNGNLSVNSNWNTTVSAGNDLTLSTNNGNIVLNPDGTAYIGGTDPSQRIATVYDLTNATLNIQGTTNEVNVSDQAGITTISLPDTIYKPTTFSLGYQEGFDITFSGDTGDTYLNQTTGDGTVHVLGSFRVDYGSTNNPEYAAFRVDPSGAVTQVRNVLAVTNDSEYQSIYMNGNTSEIGLNDPNTDSRVLTLGINGNTAEIYTSNGDLRLTSNNNDVQINANGSLYVNANQINATNNNTEMLLRKTEYWQNGSQYGIITNNSNTLKMVAVQGDLTLESNSGSINLNPNSGNVNVSGTLNTDSIRAYNGDWLYVTADNIVLNNAVSVGGDGTNGAFYVKDSNGNNVFYVDVPADETGFSGNVTIGGDLNVQGTLNAVNRTEINIEDNTIRLNTGFTGTPSVDAGIIVERGTANDTAIIWNEANDQWTLSNDGNNYYAIARKYVEVIGDASNTSFDIVHNLGTRDITVMVRENNAEYNVVETDVLMKDVNTVTIGFTDAPALNSYRVIIVG